jgi:hypothetical protein
MSMCGRSRNRGTSTQMSMRHAASVRHIAVWAYQPPEPLWELIAGNVFGCPQSASALSFWLGA